MVELLAAIVIMGILSGIAIVSVNFLLDKAQREYYKAQEDEIVLAAKSYTIEVTTKDNVSGVESIQYRYPNSTAVDGNGVKESDYHKYANSASDPGATNKFTTTAFSKERNEVVHIRACNNAGKCSSSASTTIKIDTTPPVCVSSGGSATWTRNTITLVGTCTDEGGSMCKEDQVTKVFESGIQLLNQSPGEVQDNAGNITPCPANQTVRIDKEAPVCKLKITTDGISFETKSDDVDVTGYGIGTSSTPLYNSTELVGLSVNTFYGYVTDEAGNASTCSLEVSGMIAINTCSQGTDTGSGCSYYCGCYRGGKIYSAGPYRGLCIYSKVFDTLSACQKGSVNAILKCNIVEDGGEYSSLFGYSPYCTKAYTVTYGCATGYTQIGDNYCYKIN